MKTHNFYENIAHTREQTPLLVAGGMQYIQVAFLGSY